MYDILFAAAEAKPPLEMALRIPLSVMQFLEFAIWGAWFVVLGQYLNALKFTGKQIGTIYATMSLGSIFAPIFIGAVADKYFAAELLMGILHLAGAGLLFWMARIRQARKFYWVALLYALVYSPTLTLSSSVIFAHVPDATRDFPTIRVLGTIGWIVSGLTLTILLKPGEPVNNRPLLLAAGLSAALGVFSFFLPNTPPSSEAAVLPFLDALELLREFSFAVFFGISLLITIALAFYYSFTSLYLEQRIGVKPNRVGPLMTLGQFSEIAFLLALPWFLDQLGMKWVMVLGMTAWALRYAIFSGGRPFPLIVFGIALHGICYDFFFAAGFIHVETTASADVRHSAQALFGALTYGLGMYLGTEASGRVHQLFTKKGEASASGETPTDWKRFWLVPCIGVLVSLALFAALFRTP